MDSDTDEVNMDELSLLTEDESSESSGKSESEDEQDPPTTDVGAEISDEGIATPSHETTHVDVGGNLVGIGETPSPSSSIRFCSPDIKPRTSGAESVAEKGTDNPALAITTSSLVIPPRSGCTSIRPVGGSVLMKTEENTMEASGEQVLGMAGALIKKAKDSDFSLSMETVRQELTDAKEVHFNLTRTNIHKPTAVTFGGDVSVGPPLQNPETQGPPSHIQKLKDRTEKKFKEWTEGMVMTKAATTILNKINQGRTWVTVTGCPGEGKTTAGYLVLKYLHDRGREVFDVKIPDDYFKVKDTKQPVIMLNDIFGALAYEPDGMKKWQNVLSDVFALSEHKQDDQGKPLRTQKKKIPEVSVILISRLSILNEASEHMGRYKHWFLRSDNEVNLTKAKVEASEKLKIWTCHAESYNINIDSKLVREVCSLDLSHGFPHCCRLFAAMYSKNNQLKMKHFFLKPLDFLNQSMEYLMNDSRTGPLLREMLKNDGSLDLENIDDIEKQYQYSFVAESLKETYLALNGRIIEFHHPSVYDSAAFVVCQRSPSFVINHCSLSFLKERIRVKGLQQKDTIYSHHTLLVDSIFNKALLKRFQKEFEDRNIENVLSHSSFLDESFAYRFMENHISPKDSLPVSRQIKDIFSVCDKHSQKSFLFLMTMSRSDKLLRYIHQYVELTEEEQREAMFGACEHSSVSSLEYLLQRYKDINFEVTDSDNQTPLLLSTQKHSQEVIKILLMRNSNVNIRDKNGRTPLLNICQHGVDGDGYVVKTLLEKGADTKVTLWNNFNEMSPLDLACQEGHTNIVNALLVDSYECIKSENAIVWKTPLHYACTSGHVDVASLLLEKGADINTIDRGGSTPLHDACSSGNVEVVSLLLEKGAGINTTNSGGRTPLHDACSRGNVEVVSLLLEKGAGIKTTDSGGSTPLHDACCSGNVEVVSLLLEKGADIDTIDSGGSTPLHDACSRGRVEVVSVLLEKGAGINTTDSDGSTPLHDACSTGNVEVVSLLLEKGADINTIDSRGRTPLHDACSSGNVEFVSLLLEKGAGIDTIDSDGSTPLHGACSRGRVEVVSVLLEKGAGINTTDSDGSTPLHDACSTGNVEVVSLLLEKGADINTIDSRGRTPLHDACSSGNVEFVSLLLEKGAGINTTDSRGRTPLHSACSRGNVEVVSLLLEKGAGINTTNSGGRTPLHYACSRGNVEVVSLLLEKGAGIKTTESGGSTPLHDACCSGNVEVVSLLLEKGADIDTIDSDGSTPLHGACSRGRVEVVSLLLEKGAGINTTDSDGSTPLHDACSRGRVEVVSLLLEKGAGINTIDSDGSTPLHDAYSRGRVEVVSLLLEKGAGINTIDSRGSTPLHDACSRGRVEVVSLLLEKGAGINTTDSVGSTPLHDACSRGRVEVVSLLLEKGAGINTTYSVGSTPLHDACSRGRVEVVSVLLDKGADIDTIDSVGSTPLHDACSRGRIEVVSVLLDKGADIDTIDSGGNTPLHYACVGGHVDIVAILVDEEAYINTTNIFGFTPLHVACKRGLGDEETDTTETNSDVEVVSLLLDKGADINTTNMYGYTPLHTACYNGDVDVVSLLLDNRADFNTIDKFCCTPLDTACYKGHVDVVLLLTGKGADIITTEDNAIRLLAILLCAAYDVYCGTG